MALTADKFRPTRGSVEIRTVTADADTYYAGMPVMLQSTGQYGVAVAAASNEGVRGFVKEETTLAAAGDLQIITNCQILIDDVGSTLAQTNVGDILYASDTDDFNLAADATTNDPPVAEISEFVSTSSCWIEVSFTGVSLTVVPAA